VLKRWEADGRPAEDLIFVHWSMQKALAEIQKGFDGIYANLGIPVLGALFKYPVGLWSRLNSLGDGPSDDLSHEVAQALQVQGAQRDRLSDGMYLPTDVDTAVGRLEHAFGLSIEAEGVAKKIKAAVKAKKLPRKAPAALVEEALKQGVITGGEADLVRRAEEARFDAITVDSFDLDEYMETSQRSSSASSSRGDDSMSLAS
jgi:acyl-CoA dehydrogenase